MHQRHWVTYLQAALAPTYRSCQPKLHDKDAHELVMRLLLLAVVAAVQFG